MRRYGKQFWRSVPFIRLLVPLTAGIVLSQYYQLPLQLLIILLLSFIVVLILTRLASKLRYRLRWINGSSLNLLLVCAGCLLMHFQNIENDSRWIGNFALKATAISVTLQEPLVVKPNGFACLFGDRFKRHTFNFV